MLDSASPRLVPGVLVKGSSFELSITIPESTAFGTHQVCVYVRESINIPICTILLSISFARSIVPADSTGPLESNKFT